MRPPPAFTPRVGTGLHCSETAFIPRPISKDSGFDVHNPCLPQAARSIWPYAPLLGCPSIWPYASVSCPSIQPYDTWAALKPNLICNAKLCVFIGLMPSLAATSILTQMHYSISSFRHFKFSQFHNYILSQFHSYLIAHSHKFTIAPSHNRTISQFYRFHNFTISQLRKLHNLKISQSHTFTISRFDKVTIIL